MNSKASMQWLHPMLTLPLGQVVRLDADAHTFETLEAPTAPKG